MFMHDLIPTTNILILIQYIPSPALFTPNDNDNANAVKKVNMRMNTSFP